MRFGAVMASSPRPQQNRLLGIVIRLIGAACFAVMAAMIKLGYDHGTNTVEAAFYRHAFGLIPLFVWMAWGGDFDVWRTARPLSHFSRAAVGLTTMLLGFGALNYLPLAEATTISFATPLFAVALSALLLKETVGRHRWSAVLLGFAGVLIVMQPGGSVLPIIGVALAVSGAFGVACVNILVRQLGRTERPQTSVLWFTLISMAILGLVMPFYAEAHDGRTWAILLTMGLFGGVGQLCLAASLRYASVGATVPFDYTQLLWAVLLGWFIWDTHAPASTLAGAAVIVASGLYTFHREHKLGREEQKEAAALERPAP
jgi:drug/metabolite transporter (DMT)-like permease